MNKLPNKIIEVTKEVKTELAWGTTEKEYTQEIKDLEEEKQTLKDEFNSLKNDNENIQDQLKKYRPQDDDPNDDRKLMIFAFNIADADHIKMVMGLIFKFQQIKTKCQSWTTSKTLCRITDFKTQYLEVPKVTP